MNHHDDSYFDSVSVPKSKLIGKYAYITDKESTFCQEWGEITDYENGLYHIAITGDSKTTVSFERHQFRVPHRQWLRYHAEEIKRRNAIV